MPIELLCNDGLARVGAQTRRREVEQRRELDDACLRRDRVAEAYVHLKPHLRVRDAGDELDANAAVLLLLADEADREGAEVEAHAVVNHVDREQLGEDLAHVLDAWVAETEQVEVSGRSMRLAGPEREERSSLQHEPLRVRRRREPEEQPLVRVPREHELEVLAPLARQTRQACAHRRADVRRRGLRHASASRYGRTNA